jgi:UPF0755 protein
MFNVITKYRNISVVVSALVLFLIALLLIDLYLYSWFSPIVEQEPGIYLVVAKGASLTKVANDLKAKTVLPSARLFVFYTKLHGLSTQIKAGEYFFERDTTIDAVLKRLVLGAVVHYPFTLVDGWTLANTLASIKKLTRIKHTINDVSLQELNKQMKNKHASLEGLLYPDTYNYTRTDTDIMLLQRAMRRMKDILAVAWKERAKDLPYKTSYEALIAASIIEKEGSESKDRRFVSSVLVNRLNKNMRLQMDPTVIFALGDKYHWPLKRKDLKVKSVYNTYLHKGLPPNPICFPSKDAVLAALHPAQTSYLYFYAKPDGTHRFSETYAAHKKQIKTMKERKE